MKAKKIIGEIGIVILLLVAANGASAQAPMATATPTIQAITDAVWWRPWHEKSFEEAEGKNLPILLSIEWPWQYESLMMRAEAYSDKALAQKINRDCVPVRIDADQRPDIARRYAPEGVPGFAFISPGGYPLQEPGSGEIFWGAYESPEQLEELLIPVSKLVARGNLDNYTYREIELLVKDQEEEEPQELLSNHDVRQIVREILYHFDDKFGGFGDPDKGYKPKYPHTETLRLLMAAAFYFDTPQYFDPVPGTLKMMIEGSFYTSGFGYKATTRDWNRLHDEALLDVNARLLEIYLRAFRRNNDDRLMEIAYQVMDDIRSFEDVFLTKGFSGAFYSARRAQVPMDFIQGRERGPILETLLTPGCCQTVQTYFLCTEMTNDQNWQKMGLKALDFLNTEMLRRDGRVAYSLSELTPGVDTVLASHVAMISALLAAYQRTGVVAYLELAERISQVCKRDFWVEPGYFSDHATGEESVGLLKQPRVDLKTNSQAIESLIVLSTLTGDERYRAWAEQALLTLSPAVRRGAMASAPVAMAALKVNNPPLHSVMVGSPDHSQSAALRHSCLKIDHPHLVVESVDPEEARPRLEQLQLEARQKPVVYFRYGELSAGPVSDATDVLEVARGLFRNRE